jgi:hypothetical protein
VLIDIALCSHARVFRPDAALSLLEAQNELYLRHIDTFDQYLYRNLLSCIVMYFHLGEYTKAAEEQQKFYK